MEEAGSEVEGVWETGTRIRQFLSVCLSVFLSACLSACLSEGHEDQASLEFVVETRGSPEQRARKFAFRVISARECGLWLSAIRKAAKSQKVKEEQELARQVNMPERAL